MVNFTIDQLRSMMDRPDRIRSLSVIAHVDHGKSTLTDSLIQKAGIISAKVSGDARYMDTREDEQERGITIKSTGVSMAFKYDASKYLATEVQKTIEEQEEELKAQTAEGVVLATVDNQYLINLIDSPGKPPTRTFFACKDFC